MSEHGPEPYSETDNEECSPNKEMIEGMKATGDLTSGRVERVMLDVDRGNFVCQSPYEELSHYTNRGTLVNPPREHAATLEILKEWLIPGAQVLEIGCGTGYLTTCMGLMIEGLGGHLDAVDHIPEIAQTAHANIRRIHPHLIDQRHVTIICGDGRIPGRDKQYDVILMGASPPGIPLAILGVLIKGGRMLTGVMQSCIKGGDGWFCIDKKFNGKVVANQIGSVDRVPLCDSDQQLAMPGGFRKIVTTFNGAVYGTTSVIRSPAGLGFSSGPDSDIRLSDIHGNFIHVQPERIELPPEEKAKILQAAEGSSGDDEEEDEDGEEEEEEEVHNGRPTAAERFQGIPNAPRYRRLVDTVIQRSPTNQNRISKPNDRVRHTTWRPDTPGRSPAQATVTQNGEEVYLSLPGLQPCRYETVNETDSTSRTNSQISSNFPSRAGAFVNQGQAVRAQSTMQASSPSSPVILATTPVATNRNAESPSWALYRPERSSSRATTGTSQRPPIVLIDSIRKHNR